MATKAQINANRQNAEKSTGPRTVEGKAAVRLMLPLCLSYDHRAIDGADAASLGTFSIQVSEFVEMGSFTLNWAAPAARSDGTPLSLADIAGYRVYYSESPGSYLNSVAVTDSSATSITVTDIPVGTYYMVMTTNDSGGRESGYSPEILKTVQ